MPAAATLSSADLHGIYEFALDIGQTAGQKLLDAVEQRCSAHNAHNEVLEEKLNSVDIVTQTDYDLEAFLITEITARYPLHKIVGEEAYGKGGSWKCSIDDEPTWCIDPLDGTVNFTHLAPMFCISIGLIYNSIPVIGVIVAPMLHTTYSALKGQGAWLHSPLQNGGKPRQLPLLRNPIPPLPANGPAGCIFSCEWGKDRRMVSDGTLTRKVESFVNMAADVGSLGGKRGMAHGIRSLGSAALDLAYTATGAFDIWWEGGCWEWDVAAGICILREAGGLVTTANPPENPTSDPITDVALGSRLYLAIRPAGPSGDQTGRQAQERLVREVWQRVRGLDYVRE